jgi:putative DNA primase/helicase
MRPGRRLPQKKKTSNNSNDQESRRPFFRVDDIGVWYHGFSQQGDPLPPQWICSPLHVTAKTRDAGGGEWGYLLEFADGDDAAKRWAMPASMLAADGAEYRGILLSMGLQIASGLNAKNQLSIYIQTRQLDVRARCVDRVGWNEDAYVFPDRTIGDRGERVLFQAAGGVVSQFRQSGSLEGWRENVARHCQGNSRLVFCMAAAFAGPLLHHAGIESGGFHLVGDSSSGKTTALRIAASVYGGKDYTRTWRATSNALESTAAQHSDGLLILDEIGQVDPKEVGEVVYMLGNEAGKSRSTQTATSRKVQTWRLLFLSSGETSLSDHMSAGSKGARGGHDVRLARLRADAGKGFGLFDHLHDFANGAALAEFLNMQVKQHYGTAGFAFIEWLVARADRLTKGLHRRVADLARELCPADSHGQVSRVAARFALVGVAGELATAAGITGWTEGEARDAAQVCFKAWLADRGGAGNIEHVSIVRQVRNFMSLHGEARFVWVQRSLDDHRPNTMHRAGFKRMIKDDGTAINSKMDYSSAFGHEVPSMLDAESILVEYLVSPDIFRNEICKGFDHRAVSKLLSARGFLKVDAEGRADIKTRIPGMGAPRFYCIQPAIFNGDE